MPEPTAFDPIAITGIGCRLPGGATNARTFWQMLIAGVDAIREVPQDRWDHRYYYDPEPGKPNKTCSKWAGLLDEIDTFDPAFFGITQREAPFIDPQQRLLLEATWEALLDAGQQVDIVKGEDTGVFVGVSTHDYNDLQHNSMGRGTADPYSATGNAGSIAANRISYALNFQGPSVVVDTACSSSMVAVHLACQALWNKECHSAIAAGVNCIISAYPFVAFSSMNMLSPDGRCKAFDASADGFVRGEGVGAVYLKPLAAALAAGDDIYAVIRSTAVNQDGRTSGMTVPSRGSQQELIATACRLAGVAPHEIQYAEAHGTGTTIGDLIEGSALGTILGVGRKPGAACLLGSVKTNIGHLEAGSGIAGLIKVALCLKHGMVPPNLHFNNPNPSLNFERLCLKVPVTPTPLKHDADHRLLACINSFGFGGTNAHAVLEAAPRPVPPPPPPAAEDEGATDLLLPLSARGTDAALLAVVQSFLAYLESAAAALPLRAICAAASRRRTHHEFRLAAVGRTRAELSAALTAFVSGAAAPGLHVGQPVKLARLVFVFSGQGPQWWAMGRELLEQEPVFRQTMQACHDELLKLGGCALLDELQRDDKTTRLGETQIAQAALFAIQVALAELWRSWGVRPYAVVGHSMGEVAAAYAAGVFDLPAAVRVIHHRGRCMEQTPLRGKMIAAALTQAAAAAMLATYGGRAALAAVNGPCMVSISGDADVVDEIFHALEQRSLFVRYVPVNYAFHSAHMDPVREELAASLAGLQPQPGRVKIYSTVTGQPAAGTDYDADYWWRNVRQSVLFAPAIDAVIAAGQTHFLEISPHPVLSNSMAECLAQAETAGLVLPSLRRQKPERATLLGTLGALHVSGHAVDWAALYPHGGHTVRLPDYPWQKDHYWHEPALSLRLRTHPQLNPLIKLPLLTIHPTWEAPLNKSVLTWLKDHRVGPHLIFPGAGYVEMALAAGHELHPAQPVLIEELEILRGCILPAGDDGVTLQIACTTADNTFAIQSTLTEDPPNWMQHVTGRIRAEPERRRPAPFDLAAIRRRCPQEQVGAVLYEAAAAAGLLYGPQFRGMTHVQAGAEEALGRIELPAAASAGMDCYQVHPALLDACLHPAIAIPSDGVYLPARIERIRCHARPGAKVWAYVRRTQAIAKKIIVIDLFILNDAGEVLVELTDFLFKHTLMSSAPGSGAQADWLYQPQWQLQPLAAMPHRRSPADYLPDNATLAAQLRHSAAHFSAALGMNARYQEWEPRFQQLCRSAILAVLQQLGWRPKVAETVTLAALLPRLKVPAGQARFLHRLLTLLEAGGWLLAESAAAAPAWRVVARPAPLNRARLWQELVFHFPSFHPELILLDRCTHGLADWLRGRCDAAALTSANMLEHFQADSVLTRVYNHTLGEAVAAALARRPEGRVVRMLEIGAGTGGVAASVLPRLPRAGVEYCFTDVTAHGFEQAGKKFGDYPFVQYRVLDLDLPPAEQGFADERFDLVLISNALSLTQDVQQALLHARQLLASSSLLVVLELDRPSPWHELVLGTHPRWWRFQDTALRAAQPLLPSADWQKLLSAAGFTAVEAVADANNQSQTSQLILLARGPELPQPAAVAAPLPEPGQWLLFADAHGLGHSLADALRQRGDSCLVVTAADDFNRLSADAVQLRPAAAADHTRLLAELPPSASLRGVIHLWSLDAPAGAGTSTAAIAAAQTLVCHSPLYLVQALTAAGLPALPGLWLVTRGAQPAGEQPAELALAQAPLHGLARVVMSEYPDLHCRTLDLDPVPGTQDTGILLNELLHADAETEIAWRGEARYAQRLVHGSLDDLAPASPSALTAEQCFRLESAKPGSLDQLVFRAKPRRAPGPGEVEIEICAAALNFRDVMKALGIYPAAAADAMLLGDECAGRIVHVGAGVTQFQPGDEVMALAAGCFGTHVTTVEHAVLAKPAHLTMAEAATMMVTYLTASYALSHQGRMMKGERVLIHAATGGVGQAAVRIAKAVGAEIFATAGSAEKREFLRRIGVEHVLDSRTLAFAGEIMRITGEEGIDLVLNSLAGEAIHQSLSLLRQYGRFLEIGKRDIYGNTKVGLFPFRHNLSYHAIDLGHALDPRNARPLMGGLKKLFNARKLPALPYRTFALADAAAAFRYITQARQIGKVVLTVAGARVTLSADTAENAVQLHPAATYLVAGGLGGFGLAMSQWLVAQGARHLVLSSRSGAATEEARAGVAAMQAAGAAVTVIQSDVSDPASVTALLQEIAASHPPLRGVFHVAMVLDDGLLSQLNAERFQKVTTPKINGAWNLHQQTQDLALDHFVMFSSVASIIGSPGQANYAAANAFLDALAHHRRSTGRPALTINWGVMAGVGYVARHKKLEEHFARIGWSGLTPAESLPILGRLMQQPAISQMMVSRIDWAKWSTVTPSIIETPRYAQLTTEDALKPHQSEDSHWLRDAVLRATPAEQLDILDKFLREQVAKILRTSPGKIDSTRPLNEIGIDSLMAVELIHQIEGQTGVAIPTGQLMGGAPTVQKIVEILLTHLIGGKAETAVTAPAPQPAVDTAAGAGGDFVLDAALPPWDIPFAAGPLDPQQVQAPQRIFLTGVLEFLGAFLLRDLLQQTQAAVHCLISTADPATAAQQIEAHLALHACWDASFRSRIVPEPGDLAQPLLGLEPAAFDHLAASVDVIYHAAAHINHVAAYTQLKAVNVNGSVEIIRLAARHRLKPVHYLSSTSVLAASSTVDGRPLHEDDSLPDHSRLTVGYSQSRWVAEQLFMQARACGLPVNIYRPGLLVGDDHTGISPADNIIWLFLKTCIEAGVGPDAGYNSLLTPVDFVSAAMVRLAHHLPDTGRNYHLINPAAPGFGELLKLVQAGGYPVRIIPEDQWEAALAAGSLSVRDNPVAAYQMFIPRQALASLVQDQSAEFCRNTLQGLHGTGVSCPPLNQARMQLYLRQPGSDWFFPASQHLTTPPVTGLATGAALTTLATLAGPTSFTPLDTWNAQCEHTPGMNEITTRKNFIPVTDELIEYLDQFGRCYSLPTTYDELRSFAESYPLADKEGNATYWSSVLYPRELQQELYPKLTSIYSQLRTGDFHAVPHLYVERVDYCEFGNSRPFRVRVVNQYNDNYDHFYVKTADASRVYGLELEHLLSPNRINYLMHRGGTLVEEHIAGVPGDAFIRDYLHRPDFNGVRLAKEFVKFSERCFIRLLGDMRSYNYVIDMTPDFEEVQYRVRAIDFDQQSYEGRKSLYLPQFFKENNPVVQLCSSCLNYPTMKQYQEEERSLISRRYLSEHQRISALLRCMKNNAVEPFEKVVQLRAELGRYHSSTRFDSCKSMGAIVERNLELMLGRHLE